MGLIIVIINYNLFRWVCHQLKRLCENGSIKLNTHKNDKDSFGQIDYQQINTKI